jgi:hypothetical protein
MPRNIFQQLYYKDLARAYGEFQGIIFDNVVGEIPDIQSYFEKVRNKIDLNTEILVSYHNPAWEPVLTLASSLGLRKKAGVQNWIDQTDLKNFLNLAGFKVISSKNRFFGITAITIAKPIHRAVAANNKYSVSIIIPARNEEGNIGKIIPSIPMFGKSQKFIFVEGHSKDKTWEKIIIEAQKRKNVIALKQINRGKADAVRIGLSKASADIVIIYDADRTVDAKDLPKFYAALTTNPNAFANGSRLVYPMENDAMQSLNKLGNRIFSSLFTWILGQRFKDTLCGTKAFFRRDYIKFGKDYKRYLKTDPFGDFALIFTAIKHKRKIVEIPVRYKERVYGSTNISRFHHGLLLLKMTFTAFFEFKAS